MCPCKWSERRNEGGEGGALGGGEEGEKEKRRRRREVNKCSEDPSLKTSCNYGHMDGRTHKTFVRDRLANKTKFKMDGDSKSHSDGCGRHQHQALTGLDCIS